MADERTRQMQAVCDAAVAWVSGASGAEQALRSAVARWWEAEGKRLDAAMTEERAAPAPAPRVALGQRWRRRATGAVWTLINLTEDGGGEIAVLDPPGGRRVATLGVRVRVAELLAGDAWELVAEPEAQQPADECGAVDGVLGPGVGPVCTRPRGHDGNHVATCPATGREVSAWDDLPADERWRPGAVWEHRGRSLTLLHTYGGRGKARFRDLHPYVKIADMTESNGWRYVGHSPGPAAPHEAQPPTAPELVTVWTCRRQDCDRVGQRVYRSPAEAPDRFCAWCGVDLERVGEARVLVSDPNAQRAPCGSG